MESPKPGYLPSGVYLHQDFNVNPKTGLVRLAVKSECHPPYESSFDSSWGYSRVKNPTPLQQSICDLVSQTLGDKWFFRQIRDNRRSRKYKSELKWGSNGTGLVLVYQRNAPVPLDSEQLKEQEMLTQTVMEISDKINELVAPRYTLNVPEVGVLWDRLCGGQGDWNWDSKIILVGLYFNDKEQILNELQTEISEGKGNLQALEKRTAQLKAELGK